MALAYLCKQWEKTTTEDNDVTVTAFVVDHKAREESTREANMVAGWLDSMGLKTQILELSWPESKVSAFETHARRLRFQALGQACRANRIETLLMGHHQDDNVETTLWRLCTGAKGAGLAGIPPVTRIPECHGLFGVAESGSSVTLKPARDTRFRITHANELQVLPPQTAGKKEEQEYRISTGGISICRPLLAFPKTNLLATCHENNVPFVSDPTNFDPTLTPRNAIRSLLSENKLPRALHPPSILSLIQKSNALLQSATDSSNDLLKQCTLLSLAPSTGTMILNFPQPSHNDHQPNSNPDPQIQSLTLRRITELISPFPENHFPLRSFEPFISRIFPSFSPTKKDSLPQKQKQLPKQLPFTLGGLMFQPLHWNQPPPTTTTNPTNQNTTSNTWLLSRQPYMRNRHPILPITIPIPTPHLPNTPNPNPTPHPNPQNDTSTWHLWDNRYWFRITATLKPMNLPLQHTQSQSQSSPSPSPSPEQNPKHPSNNISLLIRPLQKSDLQVIRTAERAEAGKEKGKSALMERLGRDAPGLVRFTVPVLVMPGEVSGSGVDVPLALPTMDLWLPGAAEVQKTAPWDIRWEWRYKMIDRELLELMGWLGTS
ncbi:adenine nucleotide alpha hydrolases-like protein [Aspergillus sclerotiicarbonarius CBS 121057]|uniref:tRNA(Ile)-lysidine synthetase n=1 Tax=Aspergillus sclerotiicarbonarius (strain CBS 121057 / IBT 28362) TaxID=1448318 RepID=A0A319EN70_ASPSB|nr:adenine nucleotide alpha hydrolases-like protein [Aspergillus sclerotiicarbonarius CBS 121057]